MQDYDRIRSFILSYYKDVEGLPGEIYRDAVSRGIPVIRPDMKELLRLLLLMHRPEHILEVGTAVGFSSIFMAGCLPHADICSMELDPERVAEAEENIRRADLNERITVEAGDAAKLLQEKKEASYDFVFIDAAKAQYGEYLTRILPMVRPGALIVSDNVLQEGGILESHFLVEKRDRTIHDRMREYLRRLTDTPGLVTSILPVGDGAAVTLVEKKVSM